MAYCDTPDGEGGGIWQSGGAPGVDATGNLYFVSGDGTFDGGPNFGDSFVKLSPNGTVLDYFTPHDQSSLDSGNIDLGASGVLLLPDQPERSASAAQHRQEREAVPDQPRQHGALQLEQRQPDRSSAQHLRARAWQSHCAGLFQRDGLCERNRQARASHPVDQRLARNYTGVKLRGRIRLSGRRTGRIRQRQPEPELFGSCRGILRAVLECSEHTIRPISQRSITTAGRAVRAMFWTPPRNSTARWLRTARCSLLRRAI